MGKKRLLWLAFLPSLLAVFLLRQCYNALFWSDYEVLTSPQGTNTVVIQYDWGCRPTVYLKNGFWQQKIWETPRGGFMETIHFGTEWMSEYQLHLYLPEYDEEYYIDLPQK